ncbi:MAG: cytochrome c oxidase subunit II [Nitrospinae bacterium]|nr:cytochrome c oxidase subunit II [Nitrospinota bacterium]
MNKKLWSLMAVVGSLPFLAATAIAGELQQDPAEHWDEFWHEIMIDIISIGVVFMICFIYVLIRNIAQSPDQEGTGTKLTPLQSIGWTLIPAFCFMADDFYLAAQSWQLFNLQRNVPANHYEVKVTASMWNFNYTYPNACKEADNCVEVMNELRVPAGKPILLRMTSSDVIHNHSIPDFRILEDSMPGRVTYLWFYPKTPGEHLVTCKEYCGTMHSKMISKVIAMPESEFDKWIETEKNDL